MTRYALLVLAGVGLLAVLDGPERTEGCWRRSRVCYPLPAYPPLVHELFTQEHPKVIGVNYPTAGGTAQNSSNTTFTACGGINPADTVYGLIFKDSNQDPYLTQQTANPDGSGGTWTLVFTQALPNYNDYTLRVCSTGTSPGTSPYSLDTAFSVADQTINANPCNPIVPPPPPPPVTPHIMTFDTTSTPSTTGLTYGVTITSDVAPKVIHGEVFSVNSLGHVRSVTNGKVTITSTDPAHKLIHVSVNVPVTGYVVGWRHHQNAGCFFDPKTKKAGDYITR